MICKKCGHDVTKYDVAYVGGYRVIRNGKVVKKVKPFIVNKENGKKALEIRTEYLEPKNIRGK